MVRRCHLRVEDAEGRQDEVLFWLEDVEEDRHHLVGTDSRKLALRILLFQELREYFILKGWRRILQYLNDLLDEFENSLDTLLLRQPEYKFEALDGLLLFVRRE